MKLCINCDDFNLNPRIDAGILAAVDAGLVTSVSAFAGGGPEAIEGLRAYPNLSVGLHFDLTSGARGPARRPMELALAVVTGRLSAAAIDEALERQYDDLVTTLGRPLTHLDSHEHVHLLPGIRRSLRRLASRQHIDRVRVPAEHRPGLSPKAWLLRLAFGGVDPSTAFIGLNLMDGKMSVDRVAGVLDQLRRDGVKQALWMVHAGYDAGAMIHGREDYPFRLHEFDALMACRELLADSVQLVPMDGLA